MALFASVGSGRALEDDFPPANLDDVFPADRLKRASISASLPVIPARTSDIADVWRTAESDISDLLLIGAGCFAAADVAEWPRVARCSVSDFSLATVFPA